MKFNNYSETNEINLSIAHAIAGSEKCLFSICLTRKEDLMFDENGY